MRYSTSGKLKAKEKAKVDTVQGGLDREPHPKAETKEKESATTAHSRGIEQQIRT